MEIIAVCNQKGGCGKTITSVNLAGALAKMGKKVIFLDLDPQGHGTSAFGIKVSEVTQSTYAIFESFINKEMVICLPLLMHQRSENLWVVGAHISLSTMESKLGTVQGAILALATTLLGEDLSKYDYIIIDTPPNLGFLTLNALHAANRIIVPLDVSIFSLNGVSQIENILALSKSMGFEKPLVNFLVTLYDKRSNFATSFLEKAKICFGDRLLKSVIRSTIKFREAAVVGKVITEFDPYSNGAQDYFSLAKELVPDYHEELLSKPAEPKHKEKVVRNKAILVQDTKSEKEHASDTVDIKPRAAILKKTKSADDTILNNSGETFFKFNASHANSVYLVGSFNNWTVNEDSAMRKMTDNTWVKMLPLPEGNYAYKFVVDGRWVEDPNNSQAEKDGCGGKNSIIQVRHEIAV